MRAISQVAPAWWDYTTLDREILDEAARLTVKDIAELARPGFEVRFYDTPQEFYCAEALEYIQAWQRATPDNPVGVCGPIGPTEQLPLVVQMVNALGLKLHDAHFWGMDEWVVDGQAVDEHFPLGFRKADMDLCFNHIDPALVMPEENLHFPTLDTSAFEQTWEQVTCALMKGGRGKSSIGPLTTRSSVKVPIAMPRRVLQNTGRWARGKWTCTPLR